MSAKVLKWDDEKRWNETFTLEHQLDTRPHQIHRPFEHPHHLVDLSVTRFGVLAAREHVPRWAILDIIAEQDLFPCDKLWRASPSMAHAGSEEKGSIPLARDTRGCGYTHQTLASISRWTQDARQLFPRSISQLGGIFMMKCVSVSRPRLQARM